MGSNEVKHAPSCHPNISSMENLKACQVQRKWGLDSRTLAKILSSATAPNIPPHIPYQGNYPELRPLHFIKLTPCVSPSSPPYTPFVLNHNANRSTIRSQGGPTPQSAGLRMPPMIFLVLVEKHRRFDCVKCECEHAPFTPLSTLPTFSFIQRTGVCPLFFLGFVDDL